jgi:class 3 adenylate cyclase
MASGGQAGAVEVPETRFARIGEDRIAYQVFGEGPPDLLFVAGGVIETVDLRWEWPPYAHFLRSLASFCRVITFNRRGSGASDPVSREGLPDWEDWSDDARAVLDAVGSERAAVFAGVESGPIAILFAAIEPERAQSLILYTSTARFLAAEDYPWGLPSDLLQAAEDFIVEAWGTEEMAAFGAPTAAHDPAFRRWFAKSQRAAAPPRTAAANITRSRLMDVREILPSVRTPALVIHRKGFRWVPVEQSRYLADHLPNARLLLVPGDDGPVYTEPVDEILQEVERFVTGARVRAPTLDRVLATVVFTDIVGSTERAAEEGDRRWRTLLESHDMVTGNVVSLYGGRVVKLTGDGALVTFDGPGKAIHCVAELRNTLGALGLPIYAGLHTGEIELRDEDIGGVAVHLASRIMTMAKPGEIICSRTVKDLVVGSGFEFDDRGTYALKGIPEEWQLYAVKI